MIANFNSLTLEIPENDPFKYDQLNREKVARMLKNIFTKFNKGAVVTIDSPWGTGKTTFIKMLSAFLKKDHFITLNFNAWESDYADDPLCALLSVFEEKHKLSGTIISNLGRILIAGTTEIAKGIMEKYTGINSNSVQEAVKASIEECSEIGGGSNARLQRKSKRIK